MDHPWVVKIYFTRCRPGEQKNKQKPMTNNTITLILAPLQGFTDVTFRNVYAGHFSGIDEALAPFISTMGQQRLKPSRIQDVAPEQNKGLFVVPQILGNVAKDFIFLADHLYEMGHKQVNWNLGCPHSKIAKKHRGSGLLLYPEKIDTILSELITAPLLFYVSCLVVGDVSDKYIDVSRDTHTCSNAGTSGATQVAVGTLPSVLQFSFRGSQ